MCIYSTNEQQGQKKNQQQNQSEKDSNYATVLLELRDTALKLTPERLGLTTLSDTDVYGVILDEHTDQNIITLVSFRNGDVSLYKSVGQSYIGGGDIAKINQAAKKLVYLAQSCLSDAEKANSTPIPDIDGINFYLLTKKGIFKKQLTNITIKQSLPTWSKLLDERNNIVQDYIISAKEYKERLSKEGKDENNIYKISHMVICISKYAYFHQIPYFYPCVIK